MKRKLRVAVVMGGPSAEYDISLMSGKTIAQHLNSKKFDVVPIVIDKRKRWLPAPQLLTSGRIERRAIVQSSERRPFDVALLALHSFGEDGTVQGFLETLGVPYTGSGVLASALAMDKKRFKLFCQALKVPFAPDVMVHRKDWSINPKNILREIRRLGAKVVIKPNDAGSSVATSIVKSADQEKVAAALRNAFQVGERVLVEAYLQGRELTVATLGDQDDVEALPAIEIVPTRDTFFSYDVKYDGSTKEICPARISKTLAKRLSEIAIVIHKGIGACGLIRTDFIVSRGTPYVLEANTLPGMTPESLAPKAAKAAGMSYAGLLDRLVRIAAQRAKHLNE